LRPGDLLVFNDTRVIPARLHGRKASGGRIELLVERLIGRAAGAGSYPRQQSAQTRRPVAAGCRVHRHRASVRHGDLFEIRVESDEPLLTLLEQACGRIPLPPYIAREPTAAR
jgi:S-adenosylmethionine:tRNA ribosyltransferase-isomerase